MSVGNPLRIACVGWVDESSGSISAANGRLLRAFVRQGHSVDFFANDGFLSDPGIGDDGPFVFRGISVRGSRTWETIDRLTRGRSSRAHGFVLVRRFTRQVGRVVEREHRQRPYDALLVLGMDQVPLPPGIPLVVWPQGLPGGELGFLRRRRGLVTDVSTAAAYWIVRGAYELRDVLGWRWLRQAHVVVASDDARARLERRGVSADRVTVLPYAIDLERFRPSGASSPHDGPAAVVCLGRLDPRKRVDLLPAAARLLSSRDRPVRIRVIGRPGYLSGWSAIVDSDDARSVGVTYEPHLATDEVVEVLRHADLVVQPSEDEEFGHAIAEALACGTRVVVGPSNATREYVPSTAGAVADEYTATGIADAIERALGLDPNAARAAARLAAEDAFSADGIATRLVQLLREVSAA